MPPAQDRTEFREENTVARMFWNRTIRLADQNYMWFHSGGQWRWWTWSEYGRRVEEIAHGLMALGLSPGKVAGIVSSTRLEWGLCDLGILTAGVVTVTVYPTLLAEDVSYILSHSEAEVVFVENEEQLKKIRATRSQLPALKTVIVFDPIPTNGEDVITLDELRARGRAHAGRHPNLWEQRIRDVKPGDLATLVYTSGTTGPPKGAMISHSNFVETCKGLEKLGLVSGGDHAISYLPLCHIYERISTYMYGMYSGNTCGIARGMEHLIEDIATIAPTAMVGVPRVYEKIHAGIMNNLTDQSSFAKNVFHWAIAVGRKTRPYRLSGETMPAMLSMQHALAGRLVYSKIKMKFGGRLKFLVSAAAPIAEEILDFFDALGIPIVEGYGSTECTGPATLANLTTMRIGYVGRALEGTDIRLADDGEILVKGYNVFMGYYKEPEATSEVFEDGWFHTGDIGELTEDGYLKITDRKKDIIITAGGKNIAPQNIENLIKMDPYISEALVYGDRRKYLTAILTLEEEMVRKWALQKGLATDNTLEELAGEPEVETLIRQRIDSINTNLARFETIKKFRILPKQFTLEDGELTPTMKLKRKMVTAMYHGLLNSMYEEDEEAGE